MALFMFATFKFQANKFDLNILTLNLYYIIVIPEENKILHFWHF